MKIYLDVCCLNRPFDDQTQDRIHLESEAIITILKNIQENNWIWFGSGVVLFEINQTPNLDRKNRLLNLCGQFSDFINLDEEIYKISENLKKIGFKSYDSLHLACAKKSNIDVFLSTDNKLVKKAIQETSIITFRVSNPLIWLQEILE
jgi:predicted nucleic acid-binding protein